MTNCWGESKSIQRDCDQTACDDLNKTLVWCREGKTFWGTEMIGTETDQRGNTGPYTHEVVPSALSPSPFLSSYFVRANHWLSFMSHAHATGSSSSNFQLILNNALDKYKKRTKKDLLAHPLAAQLQSCNSPSAILAVLHQQLQGLDQSRRSDERWSRWLDPTVSVLYALSSTLAAGVGLVGLMT